MKTTSKNKSKNLILIVGVIVAIIASVSTSVNANNLPYPMVEGPWNNESLGQIYDHIQTETFVVEIYNKDLDLIYKGNLKDMESEEQTMIDRSDLIIKDDGSALYLIND
ncbi:MAG: hypothetical protein ACR2MX_06740 [Cyclobacteriaceae bacterium]